jgi:hypothetical protein
MPPADCPPFTILYSCPGAEEAVVVGSPHPHTPLFASPLPFPSPPFHPPFARLCTTASTPALPSTGALVLFFPAAYYEPSTLSLALVLG